MNRVDLALGTHDVYWADDLDAEWVASHGRQIRKRWRLYSQYAMRYQSTPITTRLQGWRQWGESRGWPFPSWSPWLTDDGLRHQLHLAQSRGSDTAAKHLALGLVSDLRGAA